jgi:hypothetical protein
MGGSKLCTRHMPRCQAVVCTAQPGAAPVSCPWAGLDKLSGLKLCRSHKELGLVNEAKALQFPRLPQCPVSSSVERLVAKLFSGCPSGELLLHNLGAKLCSLLPDTDRAAVAVARKAELDRRLTEQQSGDLTKCFGLHNDGLHASALELLKPSAKVAAARDATRWVLNLQAAGAARPAVRIPDRAGAEGAARLGAAARIWGRQADELQGRVEGAFSRRLKAR